MKQNNTPRGATRAHPKRAFPKQHLILVAGLGAVLGIITALIPTGEVNAKRVQVPLQISIDASELNSGEALVVQPPAEPLHQWQQHTVRDGDNLSLIFARAGLNDRDVYHITSKAPEGKALTRIYPGQNLAFLLTDTGELSALKLEKSRLESTIYWRTGEGYTLERDIREPEVHQRFATATIHSSLFMAGTDAGMTQNTIMEMANIFGGVIDFVLDPRKGDTFHVLYEELYLDGEKIGNGDILAAEFVNRGTRNTAYRYTDETGKTGYFSDEGVSMRRAFLLSPVDFTRVSSNFNPRRLHPIYKTKRPHRGVDYAAARGTPVFAAGDGRVTASGYTKANGKYVVIQHGQAYTTKYLHLNQRKVRKGQKVSQQQVIGTVGSTGAATGPHLHYEFLVNGVHRNPRTIHKKLPKADSLASAEMPRFLQQTRSLSMQLASLRQTQTDNNTEVAQAETSPNTASL